METQPNEPVVIVEHDPRWSAMYDAEVGRIEPLLAPKVRRYEHIGSTAVTGLRAKPIVDILMGVESLDVADTCIDSMTSLDYEYVKRFESRLPQRRFFRRKIDGATTFQAHMVVLGGPFWREHLLFRDALRQFAICVIDTWC